MKNSKNMKKKKITSIQYFSSISWNMNPTRLDKNIVQIKKTHSYSKAIGRQCAGSIQSRIGAIIYSSYKLQAHTQDPKSMARCEVDLWRKW